MGHSSVHVLICHMSRILCDCLCLSLKQSGFHACRVLDDCQHSRIRAAEFSADILLLDSGLDVVKADGIVESVRRQNQDCRLLVLVSGRMRESLADLVSLRVDGCITEEASLAELQVAIDTVLSGGSFCSPEVANELFLRFGRSTGHEKWMEHLDKVRLTPREREILELIAWERMGNKQIARRLCISLYTVKNHVHNIIEKLGADDRYDAAELATRKHMLQTVRG